MDLIVRDNSEKERFEAWRGDELVGFLQYRMMVTEIAVTHTEVFDEAKGSGVGTGLVRASLDMVSDRSLALLPYCPFVRTYIVRHPEYLELVPVRKRGVFGLDA